MMEDNVVRERKLGISLILLLLLIVSGCTDEANLIEVKPEQTANVENSETSTRLIEDRGIYDYDKDKPLVHLYVTILHSTDGKPTSFYDMNHWYDFNSIKSNSPSLDVIVQEGSERGPEKGDLIVHKGVANSTFEIRGNSTRVAPQKSYKLKLLDSAGLWKGQKTINLNKHAYDLTRVRNKLSFDYFTMIPDMTSLRTQFVQLHVKDMTAKIPDERFVDYGLYTHVEQVNERYLASRGLDPNGNLYKATNFEFFRYSEQLKLKTDERYNEEAFETILEVKGSDDHTKLLQMLDDVNNDALNINDVFEHYFDRDNYLTWIAANILFGNSDTITQNFYLYSPTNSEKWFFLPWDYDGSWGFYDDSVPRDSSYQEWQSGIGMYWGVVLHKRYFKDSQNVEALNAKIESLSKIITEAQTKKLLDQYYPIVKLFITSSPDSNFLPYTVGRFEAVYKRLPEITELNKIEYYKKLENPMPIFLNDIKLGKGSYLFEWDYSFDLQGDELSYDFQLSQDPSFTTPLKQKENMADSKITLHGLAPGRYFWRVVVKDSKKHQQIAFDSYENEDGDTFEGVKELIVR
jgi:spore coat protein H